MGAGRGISRRALLRGATAATAAATLGKLAGCSSSPRSGRDARNVLLIMADDMRADLLDYMPFVNGALRAEGTKFTSMRCNVPVCQPARAGLLCGQYAQGPANGVYKNDGSDVARPGVDALPVWLEAEGVSSGMFGKYLATRGATKQPGWSTWRVLQEREQEAYGYTITDGSRSAAPASHQLTYLAAEVSDFVVSEREPWFAWFAPTNPHVNLSSFTNDPLPSTRLLFRELDWEFDLLVDTSSKPSWIRARPQFNDVQLAAMREAIRDQVREVYDLDSAIAGLYRDLEASGRLDETLIIFVSDGGVFYGEQRLGNTTTSSKDQPYDSVAKVPCVIRGPGMDAGGTVGTPVVLQDLTATIVATLGAAPSVKLDGVDLRDLVETADTSRATLYERRADTAYPGCRGIVTLDRKLNHWIDQSGEDEWEMYDLDTDPSEQTNVAHDPARLAERLELEGRLESLIL